MNKRKKTGAVAAIVVLLILLAMCSTDIMLRLAVFTYSPKSAVTMKYKKSDDRSAGKDLYVITENVPVEKATQKTCRLRRRPREFWKRGRYIILDR